MSDGMEFDNDSPYCTISDIFSFIIHHSLMPYPTFISHITPFEKNNVQNKDPNRRRDLVETQEPTKNQDR